MKAIRQGRRYGEGDYNMDEEARLVRLSTLLLSELRDKVILARDVASKRSRGEYGLWKKDDENDLHMLLDRAREVSAFRNDSYLALLLREQMDAARDLPRLEIGILNTIAPAPAPAKDMKAEFWAGNFGVIPDDVLLDLTIDMGVEAKGLIKRSIDFIQNKSENISPTDKSWLDVLMDHTRKLLSYRPDSMLESLLSTYTKIGNMLRPQPCLLYTSPSPRDS